MTKDDGFSGVVSDIGGPTANMYKLRCTAPEVEEKCKRQSCVNPTVCKMLGTDHAPLVALMKKARAVPGVRKVFVASGIRMDLAQKSPEYMNELAAHHVGGLLKVAPEHTDPEVLELMKKPGPEDFLAFDREFTKASERAGKKQHLVPYFIASHPGSDVPKMIELASFLKQNGYTPDQVQDFIPSPFDVATCMYHTGYDPMTMRPVKTARALRDRKTQRALLQFWKPENYFAVREALEREGRTELIGEGCNCLIPSRPPREAVEARRQSAERDLRGPKRENGSRPAAGTGYRPGRPTAQRRKRQP
jgi:uncharacterized radical SAM protein YgiQ